SFCSENAETTWTHTGLFTQLQMGYGGVGRIRYCSMWYVVHAKARTRIPYVEHNCPLRVYRRDLHDLGRMKFSAMFDRIHQNLAECQHQLFPGPFCEARLQFGQKLDHALRCQLLTIHAQRHPVAMSGYYVYPQGRIRSRSRAHGVLGDLIGVEWSTLHDKDTSSQRGDDFLWRALLGKNDHVYSGPDRPQFR